ncbi:MAG: flagellar basal body P-ring protein FlgI [Burkholderiaceae bacterium]|jgi:flagellar P-ring protein precursor FlgI|nr:flagellar basal body P-ring protein FlgI [Burkholderiaceae bacterium]
MLARVLFIALAALTALATPAHAERIKDLATIQGVRPNQLIGYGLVVGLDGSGDQTTQTPFTVQSLQSMLTQLGITLPPGTSLQLRNVAAVMVTGTLPAFAQPGQQVDITVSSLGNARSLRGGTLLMTPLKGADGAVYAVAQGNVLVGGAGAAAGGSKVTINHLSAGRVPNGATVERAVATPFLLSDRIRLELNTTDFSTSALVADAINKRFGNDASMPLDGRVIEVRAPAQPADRVRFMAELENLDVITVAPTARVIINARTGSIVMNRTVTLEQAAVAHGNLSVTISSQPVISQPGPLSQGQTVVAERADIQIKQEGGALMNVAQGANLADVVKALNALGANPGDLVAILQALKAAGALRAELEVI